jgi:hypothetical protein
MRGDALLWRFATIASRPRATLLVGAQSLSLRGRDSGAAAASDNREIAGSGPADIAAALQTLLADHAELAIEVRVSCRWARLLLLPWVEQLTREERWNTYARARFEEVYGDDAQAWDIRVARDLPGRDRIAVAWPALLRDQLAAAPQVRSVRVDLLEHLGVLLEHEPVFSGCLAEIESDGAGFILLVDGRVRRVRWSHFDDPQGLATAMRTEWATVLAGETMAIDTTPALAMTPPVPLPQSPRARIATAVAGGLGCKRAFCLP